MAEQSLRVLFIDDDDIDREAVERHIRKKHLPYLLQTAASESEALDALREGDFDVVLLDYDLGTATGLDLLPHTGDIPVIFVTGSGSEEIAIKAMRRGAYDYLIKDPDRNYLAVLPLTIRKVMEHKRAEVALKESEERYKELADATFEAIFISEDGICIETNRTATEMFGYEYDELIGIFGTDVIAPESKETVKKNMLSGYEEPYEVFAQRKDGSAFHAEIRGKRCDYKGRNVRVTVVQDIHKRKEAEEALKQSEEKFRTFMETASDLMYITDKDGDFSYVNESMVRTLGYSKEEMIGMHITQILSEENLKAYRQRLEILISKGEISFEPTWVTKNGDDIYGEIKVVAIYDSDGNYAGGRAVFRDFTDRKKLEAQLGKAQKMESLGIVAGGVAHDFNNLLMGILGNAEMALNRLHSDSPAKGNIERIETLGQQAAKLTKQMLDYSGKGQILSESVDLSAMISEMAVFLESSVSKKATLQFELSDDIPVIKGDPGQFRQIIMNIVTNASESLGDEGGRITITTGLKYCDLEYLTQTYLYEDQGDGDYVFLEVTDTGSGMKPEILEKIFDPFFSTKFTGRGLGLAAVLGIVRGQKGAIKVESDVRRGSIFTVLFPAMRAKGELSGDPAATASSGRTGNTILVVDDEEYVLEVVGEMLEAEGFIVLTAYDGQKGVDVFREHAEKIDLVLLDLTMPRMGGQEALMEMCRINSDIPVIVASGYPEEEASNRFKGQKPAGFINKPFRLQSLVDKITSVLKKNQ